MGKVLWEMDSVVVFLDQIYSDDMLKRCRAIHERYVNEGKLEGDFDSDKWVGNSDIVKSGIDLSLDMDKYHDHFGKESGISEEKIKNMLRCYAICCLGNYIYQTIERDKIKIVKSFLQQYGDSDLRISIKGMTTLIDFLGFIGIPDKQIYQITTRIKLGKNSERGKMQLAPMINYLVVENEINRIYRSAIDNDIFRKWFPIYFWVNITFILPLRATEMLVTPKECLYRENGKVFLKIRRTRLNKMQHRVYYDVGKDYIESTYEIPDEWVARNIEKYMELTKDQDRRFLFEYNEWMVNGMLSLDSFNVLLKEFMETHIIGNRRYDYAKFATGIKEFEVVTAGDSRPIAIANLYFQKTGIDICRQLADRVRINTAANSYTDITETIWASSVVGLQKKLGREDRYQEKQNDEDLLIITGSEWSACTSPKRLENEANLDDCIEQGHLADCIGCRFYRPSDAELHEFLESQKRKADKSARRVIDFMNNSMSTKNKETTLEEVFTSVQTDATRYRMGCNIKAEERYQEWQSHKNIQKSNYWMP